MVLMLIVTDKYAKSLPQSDSVALPYHYSKFNIKYIAQSSHKHATFSTHASSHPMLVARANAELFRPKACSWSF